MSWPPSLDEVLARKKRCNHNGFVKRLFIPREEGPNQIVLFCTSCDNVIMSMDTDAEADHTQLGKEYLR